VKIQNENTMGATGWCLDVHDLAVSKLAAGREKDLAYVEVMVRRRLVSAPTLQERLASTPGLTDEGKTLAKARLARWNGEE
jgi:hypothetical protein